MAKPSYIWLEAYNKKRYQRLKLIPGYLENKRKQSAERYRLKRHKILAQMRAHTKKMRLLAMDQLGGPFCKSCGFNDYRALHFDHINGGGTRERRSLGQDQKRIIKRILQASNEFQVLCANCNWIKRHEKQEDTARFRLQSQDRRVHHPPL